MLDIDECFLQSELSTGILNAVRKFALENGSKIKSFSKEAIKYILENPWRGNVRELENTIERVVVLCSDLEITLNYFLPRAKQINFNKLATELAHDQTNHFLMDMTDKLATLDDVIYKYIEFAIKKNDGARDKTAKDIGIDRKTLSKRLLKENSLAH